MIKKIMKLIPGLAFLFTVGLVAKYTGNLIPHISYLIIAILFGVVWSNYIHLPQFMEQGILTVYKPGLKTGIVILGARVLLEDIVNTGPILIILVIGFIVFTLLCVEFLARKFRLDSKLGSCLATGTSICGVSAVVATGGAIEVREKYLAYAIATIITFDVITVFSYPLLGTLMSLPDKVYGMWTGISMFSTGTTVAAGFAYSETAGQLATIIKMARNVFIGFWALLYSMYYARKGLTEQKIDNSLHYLWEKFPKIIIGFLLVLVLANTGLLRSDQLGYLKNTYNWLFLLSFVGLGYSINLKELKKTGLLPFVTVCITFVTISVISLVVAFLLYR